MNDPEIIALANSLAAELHALPEWRTTLVRPVVKKYAALCTDLAPAHMLALTRQLIEAHDLRGVAYELLSLHRVTMRNLGPEELEAIGQGVNSWWAVDTFARLLSGPAWVNRLIEDEVILRWAESPDLWWRRAALVSTVAFNVRSQGGQGDTRRTLLICRELACDREDMVVKALSWALRELVWFDRPAVEAFLVEFDHCLAGRVKREVNSKLTTGLKTPKKARP